jgi:predicted amidohydrolase YtcJ
MKQYAELIIENAEILSCDDPHPEGKVACHSSMAIAEGRVLAVGDEETVAGFRNGATAVLDLEGRTVLPGLADAHLHASMTAETVFDFSLYDIRPAGAWNRKDIIDRIRAACVDYAAAHPDAPILRGVGWDPASFEVDPLGLPTADDLAGIADDKAIMLRSYDHHFLWTNRKALEIAAIDKSTPAPRNGVIRRDEMGTPTGVFQESTATDLLISRLPGADYSVEQYKAGIRHYQNRFANSYGTTMIFDAFNSRNGMQAYSELAEAAELTVHVNTCFYADPSLPPQQFDAMIADRDKYHVGDLFHVGTVKFFMDGSGLSFFMTEPFEKAFLESIWMSPDYAGYPQWTAEECKEHFLKLDKAGFQIHVHCMGDAATKQALDAFEYVAHQTGSHARRHTITHLMQVRPCDIPRIRKLGVIANIQPMWPIFDGFLENVAVPMFGEARVREQYPFGQLFRKGCIVSAATDFPITIPPNPYIGIQTAMLRTLPKSHPEHARYPGRILGPLDDLRKNVCTFDDMLKAYTINAAYQCFSEDRTGSLSSGKSADFVILDRRLSDSPADEIENARAEATYFKGRKVYDAATQ